MQTGFRAKGNARYYSEDFFDFALHREYRDSVVLMLLWKEIFR